MDFTALQNILIGYVPAITVLIGFLASCFGVLTKLKNLFKNSNIEEIKAQITDSNSEISKKISDILDMYKEIIEENRKLKDQNNILIGELKRIADYEYKEE